MKVIMIVGLVLMFVILMTAIIVKAEPFLGNKFLGTVDTSNVNRIVDNETGVVCYVLVTQQWGIGSRSYPPAIFCGRTWLPHCSKIIAAKSSYLPYSLDRICPLLASSRPSNANQVWP